MVKEFSRARRVSELIQRELANIISTRLNDPRVSLLTITDVEVSKDLKYAKIFVTRLGDHHDTLSILARASGYLRRELNTRLNMKVSPSLSFEYDHSVERGVALSNLIDEVNKDHETEV